MITQENKVLDYMKKHKRGISQAEAIHLNVYDLAGRIRGLRNKGIKIDYERMSVLDDDGKERTHYHRYFLVK